MIGVFDVGNLLKIILGSVTLLGLFAPKACAQDFKMPQTNITIFLMDYLDGARVSTLINQLNRINYRSYRHLDLLIASEGGNSDATLHLYQFLKTLPINVRTFNVANVSSNANLIFCAGDERYALPNTYFLFHEVRTRVGDHLRSAVLREADFAFLQRSLAQSRSQAAQILKDCSSLSKDKIKAYLSSGQLLHPEGAIEAGFVQEIRDRYSLGPYLISGYPGHFRGRLEGQTANADHADTTLKLHTISQFGSERDYYKLLDDLLSIQVSGYRGVELNFALNDNGVLSRYAISLHNIISSAITLPIKTINTATIGTATLPLYCLGQERLAHPLAYFEFQEPQITIQNERYEEARLQTQAFKARLDQYAQIAAQCSNESQTDVLKHYRESQVFPAKAAKQKGIVQTIRSR